MWPLTISSIGCRRTSSSLALERGAQLALETDFVESARILSRDDIFEQREAVRLVAGQRRQRGPEPRQLAHEERAHDRVRCRKPLGELVAVDRDQHAIGKRLGAGAAWRIVEHGHFAEQHAVPEQAEDRLLAALQRRHLDLAALDEVGAGRRVVLGEDRAACAEFGAMAGHGGPLKINLPNDILHVGCQAAAIAKKEGRLRGPRLHLVIERSPGRRAGHVAVDDDRRVRRGAA